MDAHDSVNAKAFNLEIEAYGRRCALDWDKQRKIHKVLEHYRPGLVADIGCAGGLSSLEYLKHDVNQVEGFEISQEAIRVATQRGLKVYHWIAGSQPCPSLTHRYDAVIASEVIEHVYDTDYFLTELIRICKPGGVIIITTPNLYYWISRLKFIFGIAPWNYPGVSVKVKVDPHILLEHLRINGIREWEALFKYHGLIIKDIQGFSVVNPKNSLKQWLIYSLDSLMPVSLRCNVIFVLQTPFVKNMSI